MCNCLALPLPPQGLELGLGCARSAGSQDGGRQAPPLSCDIIGQTPGVLHHRWLRAQCRAHFTRTSTHFWKR